MRQWSKAGNERVFLVVVPFCFVLFAFIHIAENGDRNYGSEGIYAEQCIEWKEENTGNDVFGWRQIAVIS